MYSSASPSNPFALLMDPDAVFRSIEASGRLGALRSRICRPLDKPVLPRAAEDETGDLDDIVEFGSVELARDR